MDLYRASKGELVSSKINVHQGAVALAPMDLVCSTHYQIYEINADEVGPSFLVEILRSKQFLSLLSDEKNKGIKNEQGPDFLLKFQIPLPMPDVQGDVIDQIERNKKIIQGARQVLNSWTLDFTVPESTPLTLLGGAVLDAKNGWSPQRDGNGDTAVLTLSCLKRGKIDFNEVEYTSLTRDDIDNFYVKEGEFFYSRGNTRELVALSAIAVNVSGSYVYPDLLTKVIFDSSKILPEYAVILFNSAIGRKYFGAVPAGGTPNMIKVSHAYMMKFPVPFFGDIEKQKAIIDQHKKEIDSLEAIDLLLSKAKDRINDTLRMVWTEV